MNISEVQQMTQALISGDSMKIHWHTFVLDFSSKKNVYIQQSLACTSLAHDKRDQWPTTGWSNYASKPRGCWLT